MTVDIANLDLPDNIRQEAEKAEQIKAEMMARREAATAATPGSSETPSTAPQAPAPQVAPAAPVTPTQATGPTVATPSPTVAPVALAAPESTVVDKDAEIADLKYRLSVLNGNMGGTMQKKDMQIASLTKALQEVQALPVTPNVQVPTPEQAAETEEESLKKLLEIIPKEDLDSYGEPHFALMAKIAQSANKGQITALRAELDSERQERSQYMASVKAERLGDEVENLCPGFKAMNGDTAAGISAMPEWIEFLQTPMSTGSMTTKADEAQKALSAGNAGGMAAIAHQFLQLQKANNASPERPSIEEQVVPESVPGKTETKKVDPKEEIIPQQDYDDFVSGKLMKTLTPEEADALTRKFAKAKVEGRVR